MMLVFHPRTGRQVVRMSRLLLCLAAGTAALGQVSVADLDSPDMVEHLRIRTSAVEGARVRLERRTSLANGSWEQVGQPTLATARGSVDFLVAKGRGEPQTAFYRTVAENFNVTIADDGRRYSIASAGPIPVGSLLGRVRRFTGLEVYPESEIPDPVGEMIPAFSVVAESLEEALAKAGLRIRVTPPSDEVNPAFARVPDRTVALPDPTLVAGTGLPADDVPPDTTKPPSPQPTSDVPPRDINMPMPETVAGLADGGSPSDTPPEPESGRHIRLHVELGINGSVVLASAVECRGDARRSAPEGGLSPDDFVVLFRSPLARTEPSSIYGVATFHDPFLGHRFYAPEDESPHYRSASGSLRLALPVLPADTDLSGLSGEIYKVTGELAEGPLTAESFLRQLSQVEAVGVIDGTEVQRIRTVAGRGRVAGPAGAGLHGGPSPVLTPLQENGPRSKKYNIVFMGDGFANTAADQKKFNDWVETAVVQNSFGGGIHRAVGNTFNLYKINTYSDESGITRVNSLGVPKVGEKRDTALGMQYSGQWERCWIERSYAAPISKTRINNVLDDLLPEWDRVVIVVNVMDLGGCSEGDLGFVYVTLSGKAGTALGSNFPVLDHELGHGIANLGDEYDCKKGEADCEKYSDGEPSRKNLTKNTQRASIKWREWIPDWRPIPTGAADVGQSVGDVGLFPGATAGGTKFYAGIYRPSFSGVMDDNDGGYNPIGEARFRASVDAYQDRPLQTAVSGDFNGDGRMDLFHVNGRLASLYLAGPRVLGNPDPVLGTPPRVAGLVLNPTWRNLGAVRNAKGLTWVFGPSDQVLPADFDGDGRTDLYISNTRDWGKHYVAMLRSTGSGFEPVRIYSSEMPGWTFSSADHFQTGDFDGDGKADLAAINGFDWNHPHLALLRSTGTGLNLIKNYGLSLPNAFTMARNDRFLWGDLNGDGTSDLVVYNKEDWSDVVMGIFFSSATGLAPTRQYGFNTGKLKTPDGGRWTLRQADRYLLADLDGNGRKELVVFNGKDWAKRYMAIFRMDGINLAFVRVHENVAGGWKMAPNDFHYVGDFDHDGREDLAVVNTADFDGPYMGVWNSSGGGNFVAHVQKAPFGFFSLQEGTSFHVGDYSLGYRYDDLVAIRGNHVWMLRCNGTSFSAETYYPGWIQNQRYHSLGHW